MLVDMVVSQTMSSFGRNSMLVLGALVNVTRGTVSRYHHCTT